MSIKKAISAPFHKGVNFNNWLEFRTADKVNENQFTKQDFINVQALGCDVVRVPIHFETLTSPEDSYRIPEKVWGIMDRLALWAEELKIYIIFDFHNVTHVDSVTSPDVEKVLFPIWEQVANRYKNASSYLIYELMNEPHGIEISLWNEIVERLFHHVRGIDSNHYIVVGGADWNSFQAMKTLPDFKDDKVIYTFHFYDPHTFTHQGASWCHMERVVGIPFPYDPEKMPPMPADATEDERRRFEEYPKVGTVEEAAKFFDQYSDFSSERNAPIFCGEFGCFAPYADPKERLNWYRIVVGLLDERNISRTCWDYCSSFGIFEWKDHVWGQPFAFPEDLNRELVDALGFRQP